MQTENPLQNAYIGEYVGTPLVAWYKFDWNLTDSSGNQCDLSVISNRSGTWVAPTYTTLSSWEEVADVTRWGLRTTTHNPVWDTTSWASSCWVKRTANHLSVVWYWGDNNSDASSGNGIGTWMIIQQSGQLVIFKWNSDIATWVTISSNTRHHIVYSHENWTTSVYVDWVLGATKSVTYTRNTDTLRVFSQFNVGADYYEWEFDDFRLYGWPLSSNEVASLYNSNKSKYWIS